MQRAHVGRVEDVGVAQHDQRRRVRSLGHEDATRHQPGGGQLQQLDQRTELEVLDDVHGDDRAQAALGEAPQPLHRVGPVHVEASAPGLGHHLGVEVDA